MPTFTTSSHISRRSSSALFAAGAALLAVLSAVASARAQQRVDAASLLTPARDSWPTYHGDSTGRRNSRLTQITPENVKNLGLAWPFQTGRNDQIKASPILVDGVMYIS